MKRLLILLALLFSFQASAELTPEQINLEIGTPPVVLVKHTLTQRISRLIYFYEAGVIGLGHDGMIKLRDTRGLSRRQVIVAEKLIDADNPDRNSLIYAIAEAHGGQQHEPAARKAQVKRWKEQFKSGWWIEDEHGNWSRKP